MVIIDEVVPNLFLPTTDGEFFFHDYIGNTWCVLLPHPIGFTPICTTDLARAAQMVDEFRKRNVKLLGLTCSPTDSNIHYAKDIVAYARLDEFPYPIVGDHDRSIAVELGTLSVEDQDKIDLPMPVRNCLIIGPDKRVKASIYYPDSVGRSYSELLRVIDSLQLCHKYDNKIGTPADWELGDKCFVLPDVSNYEIEHLFPSKVEIIKVPSGREYMKLVDISRQK